VDVTHAAGLVLFLGYANAVRGLHAGWRVPIVAAMALAAAGYAVAGTGLARLLPRWSASASWCWRPCPIGPSRATARRCPWPSSCPSSSR